MTSEFLTFHVDAVLCWGGFQFHITTQNPFLIVFTVNFLENRESEITCCLCLALS